MKTTQSTRVAIVGAGPSGLMLSHLLHLAGIESVVLERGNREHVGTRLRAGGLEYGTVALMERAGLGRRMHELGLTVSSTDFRYDGQSHRIDFETLTGHHFFIYPQFEIVTDLIEARSAAGGAVLFDSPVTRIEGLDGDRPVIEYQSARGTERLQCEFVAGCDGYHGPSRQSVPAGAFRVYEHLYPFSWLGILADVAPPTLEVCYAYHERGFAMGSFRSPKVRRMYLQCGVDDKPDDWSADRIWSELKARLDVPGRPAVEEGPITHKSVTAMRSFLVEPMRYGRLFLAGDAAHIVPPTGAKGLNSALADVAVLAQAFQQWYGKADRSLLDRYSDTCLARNWQVQKFATDLCTMFHRVPGSSEHAERLQRTARHYLTSTENGQRWYAQNFVGLPFDA
jgi:p-hydroxybenzoate 3-monooxygenase